MFPIALEEKLIGPRSAFSMEKRVYHTLSLATIVILCMFFVINQYLNLLESRILIISIFIIQSTLYYLSRFRQMFHTAVIVNAVISYVAVIANYFTSAGIDGPNIFLFFMTLSLLVAITRRKLHIVWFVLHIVVVLVIINYQYFYPDAIKEVYPTRFDRYLDTQVTYLTVLIFIYFTTIYLKRHYDAEKRLADVMTQTVKEQKQVLENSEAKLRAFFNSAVSSHLLLGKTGEVLDFNNACRQYMADCYGVEITTDTNIFSIFKSTYKDKFIANYEAALGGAIISEEYLLQYKAYSVWWAFTFDPAYASDGEIMGVSVTATNIHERKTQEERLIEQNQALSRIAFIQSHEIRRPVASVIGLMDIIKNEGYTPSKEYLLLLEEAILELDEKIHKIMGEANDQL